MVVEDIGYVLFVEFLRMTQYPGSPFTGEIIRDLVMFFFIPTVFIILIVYMLVGRILPPAYGKLRVLLGIAVYLFIIFGGYYPAFAYLAGPYFIFLIFIMGILYYFLEHFRRRGGGSPYVRGGGSPYAHAEPHLESMSRQELLDQRDRVQSMIKDLKEQIKDAEAHGETRNESLRMEIARLQAELNEINHQLKLIKTPRFF